MLERNLNTKEYEEESRRGKKELYTISKNYDLLGDVSCISKTIQHITRINLAFTDLTFLKDKLKRCNDRFADDHDKIG